MPKDPMKMSKAEFAAAQKKAGVEPISDDWQDIKGPAYKEPKKKPKGDSTYKKIMKVWKGTRGNSLGE